MNFNRLSRALVSMVTGRYKVWFGLLIFVLALKLVGVTKNLNLFKSIKMFTTPIKLQLKKKLVEIK